MAKVEEIFFGLLLDAITGFYLAFSAYFEDQGAWRLETGAVILFAGCGILGLRLPVVLIVGYSLHGVWDVVHEIHGHSGVSLFGAQQITELPLAYGPFARHSTGTSPRISTPGAVNGTARRLARDENVLLRLRLL